MLTELKHKFSAYAASVSTQILLGPRITDSHPAAWYVVKGQRLFVPSNYVQVNLES